MAILKKVSVGCGVLFVLLVGVVAWGAFQDAKYRSTPEYRAEQARRERESQERSRKTAEGERELSRVLSEHHGPVECRHVLREGYKDYPHGLRFCTTVEFGSWVRRPEDLQARLDDVRVLLSEPRGMILWEGEFPKHSYCIRAVFNDGQMAFNMDRRDTWECEKQYRTEVDVEACKRAAWRKER